MIISDELICLYEDVSYEFKCVILVRKLCYEADFLIIIQNAMALRLISHSRFFWPLSLVIKFTLVFFT